MTRIAPLMGILRALAVVLAAAACAMAAPRAGYAQSAPPTRAEIVAQDPLSGRLFVADPASSSVFVLNAAGSTVLRILRVPAFPAGLAFDGKHATLYVASQESHLISAIDTVTYRVRHVYFVGGAPAALTLAAKGAALLYTDAGSGFINRVTVGKSGSPGAGSSPQTLLSLGPGAGPKLAPPASVEGQTTSLWARGFAPGEPVNIYWVYWNSRPLAHTVADAAGFINTSFRIPVGAGLGAHMIILYGQLSTHSDSVIMTVVRAPPPPKPKKVRRPAPLPVVVQRLLAANVTVPNPLAGGAKKGHAAKHAASAGITIPLIYLSAVPLVLLLARVPAMRKRRRIRQAMKAEQQNRSAKGKGKGKKGTGRASGAKKKAA